MHPDQTYIIAPKREFRQLVPPNWQERLTDIADIRIVKSLPLRVWVQATEQAIAEVRTRLGEMYYIEPSIPHYPSKT